VIDIACAMGASGEGAPQGGEQYGFFIMMAALFAIFYFLLIRPQQKKQKEMKRMLAELTYGDSVVTIGGIHGKIVAITDDVVTIEVADKVKLKVSRPFIGEVIKN
jgi:preprotein translocase subunit YajC